MDSMVGVLIAARKAIHEFWCVVYAVDAQTAIHRLYGLGVYIYIMAAPEVNSYIRVSYVP